MPWVSMAEALGWQGRSQEFYEGRLMGKWIPSELDWPVSRPSPTIAGALRAGHIGSNGSAVDLNGTVKVQGDGYRLEVEEAAILQTFPADYPWQGAKGKKSLQIGNSVPPLLAEHVLNQVK